MQELLFFTWLMPLATGALVFARGSLSWLRLVHGLGLAATCFGIGSVVSRIVAEGHWQGGLFYVDALSGVLLVVIGCLAASTGVVSLPYMEREWRDGHLTLTMLRRYYALLHAFIGTMLSVVIMENLGLIWVAVEATTLASALLVAFYFNRSALEAAWKYVMVCTVGICLALLGTMLLYYGQVSASGSGAHALSWLALQGYGAAIDSGIAKLAFVFVVIGFGTKIGLAPLHTWLPDAHSQAPSPVSGLLSGALLSCACYALLRYWIVLQPALPPDFGRLLLLGFGVTSVAIAVPFILVQHDIKRLLAYSSVEHMGLVAVGVGIGTPLAVYGALFHIINHALAKSALFYLAGSISQAYRTRQLLRIRQLASLQPMAATLLLLALLAITGMPPFGVFTSKLTIVWALLAAAPLWLTVLLLLLLGAVFAGMLYYGLTMLYGARQVRRVPPPLDGWTLGTAGASLAVLTWFGCWLPEWLQLLLTQATVIVRGG